MTRTREQVRESFLLDEVRRLCSNGIETVTNVRPIKVRGFNPGYREGVGHTLADALAALYADLTGNPAPPLPSAEEVREARERLVRTSWSDGRDWLSWPGLRAMHDSDYPRDRLMARCVVEVGDA